MKLHFQCVPECGKCCSGPPQFTLFEAMTLWNEFIIDVPVHGAGSDTRAPPYTETARLARTALDHIKECGAFVVRDGTFEAALRFTARGVELNSEKRCPSLLADGRCGIYEKRPATCAAVPLDYMLPPHEARHTIENMERAAKSQGFKCRFSDDAPVIWEDGKLVTGTYKDGYERGIDISQRDAEVQAILTTVLFGEGEKQQQEISAAINTITSGHKFTFEFPFVLVALRIAEETGISLPFPLPDFATVAERQLQLIKSAISENLARKRPTDREKTNYLRRLETTWKAMVKE